MVRPSKRASSPAATTPRRRTLLAAAVTAAVVIAASSTPTTATGAWFTAQKTQSNNALQAAALQPVTGLSATARNDGTNIRWVDAQKQTWATANRVTSGVTYTVTRTTNDQSPTVIYSGAATSVSDAYPPVRSSTTAASSFSAGDNVAGSVQDGSVWTWGTDPTYGALGTASSSNPYPVKVTFPTATTVTSLSYTDRTAVATGKDGSVWLWGSWNPSCTQGDSQTPNTPIRISTPSGRQIVSATVADACSVIQLASDGTAWYLHGGSLTQVVIPGGRRVAQLTKSAIVLATDGTVWGWGYAHRGRLAEGTTDSTTLIPPTSPVQAILPAGTYAKQLSSFHYNTAVLLNNNTIWASGYNSYGQLGANLPKTTSDNTGAYGYLQRFQAPSSKTWSSVSVGSCNIAAIATDGSIYTAGNGAFGQLGNGTNSDTSIPVAATIPADVQFKALDLGTLQTYSPDQNGTYWGWGMNQNLQGSAAIFGTNDTNRDRQYYRSPMLAATNQVYKPSATVRFCDNGGTPNDADYCPPSGTVKYLVQYKYQSWTADMSSVAASATATQTGTAVIGGPGSSNMCLTISDNGNADGTPVVLASCNSSASAQQWSTWSDGTFRANGKCLDMKGNTPGVVVQLWNCNGLGFQWWVPRDDGSFFNPTSQLCLSDPSGAATAGTQLQIATCNGSPSQRWKLT